MGIALGRAGEHDEAKREFERARLLSLAKDRRNEAETLTNRGIQLLSSGAVGQALEIFSQALAMEPELAAAHHYSGLAWSAAGKWDKANQAFAAALRYSAADAEIHYNFGVALKHQGNWSEAAREFAAVVELNPGHPLGYWSLADAVHRSGDHTRAKVILEQARAKGPCPDPR